MHRPQDIEKVLRKFPIEDVWGIGRRSAPKLKAMGITTAYDYTQLSELTIRHMFGITGLRTWRELRGEPCIEFEDGFEARQSICVSRSFSSEIYDVDELCEQIANFASTMSEKLRRQNSVTCEISVFAYTNRFREDAPQTYGNQLVQLLTPTNDQRSIVARAVAAARELYRRGYGYKKAGVIATHLAPSQSVMHSLFEDAATIEREHRLTSVVDTVNKNFGKGSIKLAVQGSGHIKSCSDNQSPHYTTRWTDIPTVTVK